MNLSVNVGCSQLASWALRSLQRVLTDSQIGIQAIFVERMGAEQRLAAVIPVIAALEADTALRHRPTEAAA